MLFRSFIFAIGIPFRLQRPGLGACDGFYGGTVICRFAVPELADCQYQEGLLLIPYWYTGSFCRVNRDGGLLHIYSDDLSRELAAHRVTWGRRDSFCEGQYADGQPAELPSTPVTTTVRQLEPPRARSGFEKFDFEGRL